jgi:hypothetical protein
MSRNRNSFKQSNRRQQRRQQPDNDFMLAIERTYQGRRHADTIQDGARVIIGTPEKGGSTAFWYALTREERSKILELRKRGQVQVRGSGALVEISHHVALTHQLIAESQPLT